MRKALSRLKARRFAALTALTMFAAGPVAAADALPPPPYAADQAQYGQAQYGQSQDPRQPAAQPQVLDRYGGGYRHTAASGRPQPSSQTAPAGPRLAWAGKVEAQPQAATSAQDGGWSSMSQRWSSETQPQARPQIQPQPQAQAQPQGATPAEMAARMPPPSNPWRPYQPGALASQAAAPRPAPTSIYDAPQSAPAPQPQAAPYRQAQAAPNSQGGPRFYSLHKEYGIQPDPIPLPPQFFGPTADLSAPATDPLSRRTTTINGQTKTVNVPDDQGAQ